MEIELAMAGSSRLVPAFMLLTVLETVIAVLFSRQRIRWKTNGTDQVRFFFAKNIANIAFILSGLVG